MIIVLFKSGHVFLPCVITVGLSEDAVALEHRCCPDAVNLIHVMLVTIDISNVFHTPGVKDLSEWNVYGVAFDEWKTDLSANGGVIKTNGIGYAA